MEKEKTAEYRAKQESGIEINLEESDLDEPSIISCSLIIQVFTKLINGVGEGKEVCNQPSLECQQGLAVQSARGAIGNFETIYVLSVFSLEMVFHTVKWTIMLSLA